MQTADVNYHGKIITLNEKFIPGFVAGGLIYWCDEHKAYHVRDDYFEERHIEKMLGDAAKSNDMPAWADGQPLNPRAYAEIA